ncbi:hypothetical protein SNEBB_006498 [Seison nebaliae]|nr:hypothetical protein SNEBB_006498 [Seison nebaliae]
MKLPQKYLINIHSKKWISNNIYLPSTNHTKHVECDYVNYSHISTFDHILDVFTQRKQDNNGTKHNSSIKTTTTTTIESNESQNYLKKKLLMNSTEHLNYVIDDYSNQILRRYQDQYENVSKSISINQLPDKCLLTIFSYLTTLQKYQMTNICQRWRQLIWENADSLWRDIIIDGNEDDKKLISFHFHNSNFYINNIIHLILNKQQQLTPPYSLEVRCIGMKSFKFLKSCKRFELSSKLAYRLIEQCPNCTKIFFNDDVIIDISQLFQLLLSNYHQNALLSLDISGCRSLHNITTVPYFQNNSINKTNTKSSSSNERNKFSVISTNRRTGTSNRTTSTSSNGQSGYAQISNNSAENNRIDEWLNTKYEFIPPPTTIPSSPIGTRRNRCTIRRHLIYEKCCDIKFQNNFYRKPVELLLTHLNLSDCHNIDEQSLLVILKSSPFLTHLYLRRCLNLTDTILLHYSKILKISLIELSLIECIQITSYGIDPLLKNCGNELQYLSVAKCHQISEKTFSQLLPKLNFRKQLKYLNVRGCSTFNGEALLNILKETKQLRSIDIGRTSISDEDVFQICRIMKQNEQLNDFLQHIRRISFAGCVLLTDASLIEFAIALSSIQHNQSALQYFNIRSCPQISKTVLYFYHKYLPTLHLDQNLL